MTKSFFLLCASAVVAGCASTIGKKIDTADLNSFKSGVTTIHGVEGKLGTPNSQSTDAQGVTTLSYVYQHTRKNGFLASTAVQQQEIDFNFDKNGTLKDFTQSNYNNVGNGDHLTEFQPRDRATWGQGFLLPRWPPIQSALPKTAYPA